MIDIVWKLSVSTLERESEVRPLLELVAESDGFEPVRYDLNQRGKWRDFELDRAVVDTLTQRTQLVRIDGRGPDEVADEDSIEDAARDVGGSRAIIATGKHDEQPTCMIRLAADGPESRLSAIEGAVDHWDAVCEALSIDRLHVTGPEVRAWMTGLVDDEEWPEAQIPAAYVVGWPSGRPPFEWRRDALDALSGREGTSADAYPVRDDRKQVAVVWLRDPDRAFDEEGDGALGERLTDWVRRCLETDSLGPQSSS